MIIAKQSTARTVIVGPILDSDGVAVTDAVVSDLKLSKNGAAPAALNGSSTLTHRNTGHYSLALTASDLDTVGQAEVVIDDGTNACPVKVITVVEEAVYDDLYASGATGIGDVYHADIDLRIDAGNSQDEWTVTWFKNGVRVTSGITSPTIQVVKRADGTDLIASTTPTQIGSTGSYKHDEGTNRLTAGEAALCIVGATIDSSARSFSAIVGRDSSS